MSGLLLGGGNLLGGGGGGGGGSVGISDVTGLQAALDAKAATDGPFAYADVSDRKVKHVIGFISALSNSEVFEETIFDEAVSYPTNYSGSSFKCSTPDGSNTCVLTVKKITAAGSSSTLGTITVGTDGAITVSVAAHSFAAGDRRTIEGPATARTTARFVGMLVGTAG